MFGSSDLLQQGLRRDMESDELFMGGCGEGAEGIVCFGTRSGCDRKRHV